MRIGGRTPAVFMYACHRTRRWSP